MKPSRMQFFYAQHGPWKVWFLGILVSSLVGVTRECDLTLAVLKDPSSVIWILAVTIITVLVSLFVAAFLGWFLLGPLYHQQVLKNGGPFKPGDVVEILAGPYRGRVAHVYQRWHFDTVRVELGEEAKAKNEDVMSAIKLLRYSAGPPP